MQNPIVSIIIPTYNRAHLIGETLDSIIAQTYTHWECIIVDDGSTDNTFEILHTYQKKDDRFLLFKRPNNRLKGANACRNIGIDKALGEYIVFFDSDDLMTPNHIETKLKGFKNDSIDFVITKTKYFNKPEYKKDHKYNFDRFSLNLNNFLAQRVKWLTLDVCIKTEIASQLRFNEKLQAGQEFNFYAKLLSLTTQGIFLPKVISLRRYHEGSIQNKIQGTSKKEISSYLSKWNTYLDLKSKLSKKEKRTILYSCIKLVIKLKKVPSKLKLKFIVEVFKVYGFAGIYFIGLLIFLPFDRGYIFHKYLRKLSI